MSTTAPSGREGGARAQAPEQQAALIRQWVLRELGVPAGLQLVQVRRLWEGRYRVNVLVGLDAGTAKVADSFFLEADEAGDIVGSTPGITRRY